MYVVNKFTGKFQSKIHHVKDTNVSDDKKEAVVMTPLSEKKLLTT